MPQAPLRPRHHTRAPTDQHERVSDTDNPRRPPRPPLQRSCQRAEPGDRVAAPRVADDPVCDHARQQTHGDRAHSPHPPRGRAPRRMDGDGQSPGSRIPLAPAFPPATSGLGEARSPVTVARSRRIPTGFLVRVADGAIGTAPGR
jgi:hypothetical protein